VLRRPPNVAWYSGGGRTHVVAVQETGVAAVVVSRDRGDEVVAPVNEAPRLEAEELGGLNASFRVVRWDADLDRELPHGARVGSDVAADGARDVSAAVAAARRSLTEAEVDRYRVLGRDAATALSETLSAVTPDDS
jgi:Xaa-Pro dipeptidase